MSSPKWILLAEDDPQDADLVLRALASNPAEWDVIVVTDGLQALDCLYRRKAFITRDRDPPALVLLDLKMPRVDGLMVLSQIKQDASLKAIPVVVFTSSSEDTDMIRSYQMGANAYVVKPLGFREFAATMDGIRRFWLDTNEPPPVPSNLTVMFRAVGG